MILLYRKPKLKSYSFGDLSEIVGTAQVQYTGTLTMYGVKSTMYSPAEQNNNAFKLVKLDKNTKNINELT